MIAELENPHLDMYGDLLDSLWRDLHQSAKVEEAPIIQNIQNSPVPPIPPTPMAARFSPLRLPIVLHDLPQNYS